MSEDTRKSLRTAKFKVWMHRVEGRVQWLISRAYVSVARYTEQHIQSAIT